MSITPLKFDGPMLLIFLSAKNTEDTVIESFSHQSLAIIIDDNKNDKNENSLDE